MKKQATLVWKTQANLGESPFWHQQESVLYWIDIFGQKVHRYDPAKCMNTSASVGQDIGTVVPRESGGLLIFIRDGVAALDFPSSKIELLVDLKKEGIRANDGKCDPGGRFWVGTNSDDLIEGAGSLYCVNTDLTVRTMVPQVTNSNGLAWTADHKTLYYIDSNTYVVVAYDYDLATGNIANQRVVLGPDDRLGLPDGMAIDIEDKLWIASWPGTDINRWDPVTGELLETVTAPGASQVTACAFGGQQMDELYITSTTYGLDKDGLVENPLAGSLFKAKLDICGQPGYIFRG